MLRKVIFIAGVTLILSLNIAWAEEEAVSSIPTAENRQGLILPRTFEGFKEIITNEIEINNAAETFSGAVRSISYDEQGRISTVSYQDKTINYSYTFGRYGELVSCKLSSDNGVILEFTNTEDGLQVHVYNAESTGEDTKDKVGDYGVLNSGKDRPITVILPNTSGDLETMARRPMGFDFEEIRKSLAKASKAREEAYKEYITNTEPYYGKVLGELKARFDSLKSEGINLNENLKDAGNVGSDRAKYRRLIDDAVGYINYEMQKDGVGKVMAREFSDFEKRCNGEFLQHSKEIYDAKIKKALEYINGIIDKLMASKLAIYLDAKKDKIDAIIKLPGDSK